jgi:hypothetical protein
VLVESVLAVLGGATVTLKLFNDAREAWARRRQRQELLLHDGPQAEQVDAYFAEFLLTPEEAETIDSRRSSDEAKGAAFVIGQKRVTAYPDWRKAVEEGGVEVYV